MRILIDGDACPVVKETIDVANLYQIPIILITDTAHIYQLNNPLIEVIIVDKGSDSVDFALVNRVKQDDIIITGDYGVAAMVLAKKAHCLNHNGSAYTDDNMDQMLYTRHLHKEIRKVGGKTPHKKKRKKEQNETFKLHLTQLIEKNMTQLDLD